MNTSGIQPISSSGLKAYQHLRQPDTFPPPPPRDEVADTVDLSPNALQQAIGSVPDAVRDAVTDLQGDQANMAADFRAIGDYFRDNGGRAALDAFMRSNFTEAQLRAFPPPVDGARYDPAPPPPPVPEGLYAAVSDLHGSRTNMGDDLKTIGDYFREHGGREAHRNFMRANFGEAEREAIRAYRDAAEPSISAIGTSGETA